MTTTCDGTVVLSLDGVDIVQVGNSATVAGAVMAYAGATVPEGFLECNGAVVSREDYADLFAAIGVLYGEGDGTTTFALPDLRGEFIRGYDNGRGVDDGRVLGTAQDDELKKHDHGLLQKPNRVLNVQQPGWHVLVANSYDGPIPAETNETGGIETRPRNIAMMFKA